MSAGGPAACKGCEGERALSVSAARRLFDSSVTLSDLHSALKIDPRATILGSTFEDIWFK
jgi:hypothetical protein